MAFQHHELIQRLFIPNCETEFLSRVIPLNNNTGRDSIVAMMPQCNANGILANWNPPEQSVVEAWLKALNELPEAIESPMVRPPRPAEVEEMKRRLAAVEYSQDTKEDEPLPPQRGQLHPSHGKGWQRNILLLPLLPPILPRRAWKMLWKATMKCPSRSTILGEVLWPRLRLMWNGEDPVKRDRDLHQHQHPTTRMHPSSGRAICGILLSLSTLSRRRKKSMSSILP